MLLPKYGEKNCDKLIVAMALPKYEKKKNLWQTNCGNDIAEKRKKKKNCGNAIAEIGGKKLWQTNCGNGIAKIGKKKLWQWHYRNRGEKKIVTN